MALDKLVYNYKGFILRINEAGVLSAILDGNMLNSDEISALSQNQDIHSSVRQALNFVYNSDHQEDIYNDKQQKFLLNKTVENKINDLKKYFSSIDTAADIDKAILKAKEVINILSVNEDDLNKLNPELRNLIDTNQYSPSQIVEALSQIISSNLICNYAFRQKLASMAMYAIVKILKIKHEKISQLDTTQHSSLTQESIFVEHVCFEDFKSLIKLIEDMAKSQEEIMTLMGKITSGVQSANREITIKEHYELEKIIANINSNTDIMESSVVFFAYLKQIQQILKPMEHDKIYELLSS